MQSQLLLSLPQAHHFLPPAVPKKRKADSVSVRTPAPAPAVRRSSRAKPGDARISYSPESFLEEESALAHPSSTPPQWATVGEINGLRSCQKKYDLEPKSKRLTLISEMPSASRADLQKQKNGFTRFANPTVPGEVGAVAHEDERRTCHWCRQKNLQLKMACSRCVSRCVSSHWCAGCLDNRFGENLLEIQGDIDWQCPICRGICNCSGPNCLRSRNKLLATGPVKRGGYASAAHFLILGGCRKSSVFGFDVVVRELNRLVEKVKRAKRDSDVASLSEFAKKVTENMDLKVQLEDPERVFPFHRKEEQGTIPKKEVSFRNGSTAKDVISRLKGLLDDAHRLVAKEQCSEDLAHNFSAETYTEKCSVIGAEIEIGPGHIPEAILPIKNHRLALAAFDVKLSSSRRAQMAVEAIEYEICVDGKTTWQSLPRDVRVDLYWQMQSKLCVRAGEKRSQIVMKLRDEAQRNRAISGALNFIPPDWEPILATPRSANIKNLVGEVIYYHYESRWHQGVIRRKENHSSSDYRVKFQKGGEMCLKLSSKNYRPHPQPMGIDSWFIVRRVV